MIEFAPNPSGPMHIGNFRTYAVAYLEAQKTGEPLSIRFDADSPRNVYDYHCMFDMLKILEEFQMSPDLVEYNTNNMILSSVPRDMVPTKLGTLDCVCVPNAVMDETLLYSYEMQECIDENGNILKDVKPSFKMREIPNSLPGFFACKVSNMDTWMVHETYNRLLNMNLRGVGTIVRGVNLSLTYNSMEKYFIEYFRMNDIKVLYTSVVFGKGKMLEKHTMGKDDYGTVAWAIDKYGYSFVLSRILASARNPLPAAPVITIEEIFE